VTSPQQVALSRFEAGEDWVIVSDWLDAQLADVEIVEENKRLQIRCSIEGSDGSKCRKIMGEVFETDLGGVLRVKYRKREEPLSEAGFARDLAFERRTRRNTPQESDSDADLVASMKRRYVKEQRYFIWNVWGQLPDHPPVTAGTFRQAVCLDHGVYPFDFLNLEKQYVQACSAARSLEVSCSLAVLPPAPPGGSWTDSWWT
jgi:hypothetical protein